MRRVQIADFVEPTLKSWFICFKIRSHERLDEIFRKRNANYSCTHTQNVHVVVSNTLAGRVGVVAKTSSNAWILIGSDSRSNSAAADNDSTFGFARLN